MRPPQFLERILTFLYWNAPDKVYAVIVNFGVTLFYVLSLNLREKVFTFPSNNAWMAYYNGSRIFVPSPKETYRIKNIKHMSVIKKYTLKPYVTISRDDVVIDVGAYIREFTIPCALKARYVIAIEPDPKNYYCLKRNTENLRNVICIPKAAWNRKGFFELKLGTRTSDSSLIGVCDKPLNKSVVVEADTLDNIVSELGEFKEIGFLKIDAEGAEPEVLEGAKNLLKIVKKVAIDCTAERLGKPTFTACSNILTEAGFEVRIISEMVFAWK